MSEFSLKGSNSRTSRPSCSSKSSCNEASSQAYARTTRLLHPLPRTLITKTANPQRDQKISVSNPQRLAAGLGRIAVYRNSTPDENNSDSHTTDGTTRARLLPVHSRPYCKQGSSNTTVGRRQNMSSLSLVVSGFSDTRQVRGLLDTRGKTPQPVKTPPLAARNPREKDQWLDRPASLFPSFHQPPASARKRTHRQEVLHTPSPFPSAV